MIGLRSLLEVPRQQGRRGGASRAETGRQEDAYIPAEYSATAGGSGLNAGLVHEGHPSLGPRDKGLVDPTLRLHKEHRIQEQTLLCAS